MPVFVLSRVSSPFWITYDSDDDDDGNGVMPFIWGSGGNGSYVAALVRRPDGRRCGLTDFKSSVEDGARISTRALCRGNANNGPPVDGSMNPAIGGV